MKGIKDLLNGGKRRAMWLKLALLPKESVRNFKIRMRKLVLKMIGYPLPILLLVGLAIRLALAPLTSDPNDTVVWYIVSNDSLAGLNFYTTLSFSYPPLWAYILSLMTRVPSLLISPKLFGVQTVNLNLLVESLELPETITSPLFNILYKIPLIVADALVGLLLYKLVNELRNEKTAKFCFLLWFFNPLVIAIDSIHGQFDILSVLMTILSFGLFYKRNYFFSGIALGLGALFKIYPFFLFPLYLFSVASLERNRSSDKWNYIKNVSFQCAKLVAGTLFTAAFLLPFLANNNFFHVTFFRTQVIGVVGGMSPFSIVLLPGFESILQWILNNASLTSRTLITLCLTLSCLIGVICYYFGRQRFLEAFVSGHIAVLLVVYMTSLIINSQYILWILPFLILIYGLYSHYLIRSSMLSIFAVIFLIGLGGPFFFLYPTAVFTPFLEFNKMYANVTYFQQNFRGGVLLLSGISGMILLLSLLIGTLRLLLRTRNKQRSSNISTQKERKKNRPLKSMWSKITPLSVLVSLLIVLFFAQFLMYIKPLERQNVAFSIDNYEFSNESHVKVWYRIKSGNYPSDLQILVAPIVVPHKDKDVFVYYDEDFPSSFVGKAGWIGFWDHVTVELQLRGYNGSIKRVDANELRLVMQEKDSSLVIIPSGVFPDTVHTKNESLVGDWLQSGGTLVWIGDMLGYYSGHNGKEIDPVSEYNPGLEGQTQILGFNLFNETVAETAIFTGINSNFSDALDLQYPNARFGAPISEVRNHGGFPLGRITNSEGAKTAIAYIPIGNGNLVLFGGGIGRVFTLTGEDVIAKDVAQILCSGFPFFSGDITFKVHELERNEETEGVLDLTLSNDSKSLKGVIVIAFSKVPYVRFFSRHTLFSG